MCRTPLYTNKHKQRKQDMSLATNNVREYRRSRGNQNGQSREKLAT